MLSSSSRIGVSRSLLASSSILNASGSNLVTGKAPLRSFNSSSSSPTRSTIFSSSSVSSLPRHSLRSGHGNGLHRGALVLPLIASAITSTSTPSSRRNLSLWPSSSKAASASTATPAEEAASAMALPPSAPGESTSIESDSFPSISTSESFNLPSSTSSITDSLSSSTSSTMTELSSYGLGHASDSYFNIRYAELALDWLVNTTGLPWWAVIASLTIAVRLTVSPILIWSQGNAIRMNNIQPRMQEGMKEITRAKATGDQNEMAEAAGKVRKLMKDNDVSVLRGFAVPLIQMPIFVTFFFALRAIANAGLPSLQNGGFSWITDLSVADPFYILPCLSAALTLAVLETGAETGGVQTAQTNQQKMIKNVLRVVTVGVIPFIAHFPAAVFVFWSVNNGFSLIQLLALRTEWLRKKLGLPEKIIHPPKPDEPQSFMDSVRQQMKAHDPAEKTQTVGSRSNSTLLNPSSRRQVDSQRESAMRELMQEKSKPTPLIKSNKGVSAVQRAKNFGVRGSGDSSLRRVEKERKAAARDEKRRRVENARERRG